MLESLDIFPCVAIFLENLLGVLTEFRGWPGDLGRGFTKLYRVGHTLDVAVRRMVIGDVEAIGSRLRVGSGLG